ncbi:MAG: type II toxin-antitoxin system Phd/YefM family antitoxin [Planctomycetes bacterium]|nr:type II toxin-antitoxin system Phd/YefM family antitoxin [Planctomycetota bacterium]MCD7896264.1 type II toxin-antitoxin system Phd/YefM family antitoxin [Planctomycetaceae bacterium]
MDAVSDTILKANFDEALNSICQDHMPVIVTRQDNDPVVLISLEDYNQMLESLHLLGNPANAEHLRASIADANAGKTIRVSLDSL